TEAEAALRLMLEEFADAEMERQEEDGVIEAVLRHPDPDVEMGEAMFRATVAANATLLELRPETARLEDVFRRITGGDA
ncbi:MAG: hypothetical protein R8L58_01615, partial [Mariprofundaceae bacterium]